LKSEWQRSSAAIPTNGTAVAVKKAATRGGGSLNLNVSANPWLSRSRPGSPLWAVRSAPESWHPCSRRVACWRPTLLRGGFSGETCAPCSATEAAFSVVIASAFDIVVNPFCALEMQGNKWPSRRGIWKRRMASDGHPRQQPIRRFRYHPRTLPIRRDVVKDGPFELIELATSLPTAYYADHRRAYLDRRKSYWWKRLLG
jgi:hypothetical protein